MTTEYRPTPYDTECAQQSGYPGFAFARCKREGYLRALADVQPRLDDAASLVDYAACVLDKPEDRLYHASDGTWWSNPNGPAAPTLKSADMPEPLRKRIDALIAALQDCAAGLDEIAAYLRRRGDNPELAIARAAQARAALKLAGKEA